MYFDRLADFVYVEFMKGLQKGFVPKKCELRAMVPSRARYDLFALMRLPVSRG